MDRLKDKVAIVTGGASGIGEAAVRLFVAEGARVVIADIQDEEARTLQEELGNACIYVRTDVSRAQEVKKLVQSAIAKFGSLDVLYNNAAVIFDGKNIADHPEEEFDRTIAIDLKGVWLGIKYAVPEMLKNGGGSIVNTASVAGLLGIPGQSAYGAAKGGVVTMTRHCATEYAEYGIRINCVCPGGTLTPLVYKRRPGVPHDEVERLFAARNPMQRAARPHDIAFAALWLASDESQFVTGQTIVVDCGTTASAYRGRTPQ